MDSTILDLAKLLPQVGLVVIFIIYSRYINDAHVKFVGDLIQRFTENALKESMAYRESLLVESKAFRESLERISAAFQKENREYREVLGQVMSGFSDHVGHLGNKIDRLTQEVRSLSEFARQEAANAEEKQEKKPRT